MAEEWKIKPAMHRMIVQVIPKEDKLYGEQSKLILPNGQPDDTFSKLYRVVVVGEGEIGTRYQVGDIVVLGNYAGGIIIFRKEQFYAVGEGEVLAKIEINDLELPVN